MSVLEVEFYHKVFNHVSSSLVLGNWFIPSYEKSEYATEALVIEEIRF